MEEKQNPQEIADPADDHADAVIPVATPGTNGSFRLPRLGCRGLLALAGLSLVMLLLVTGLVVRELLGMVAGSSGELGAVDAIAQEQERLERVWMRPQSLPEADAIRVFGRPLEREYTLGALLRRPDVSYRSLMTLPNADGGLDDELAAEQVEIQAKYHGYIERQRAEVARRAQEEETRIPVELDYREVRGLSKEAQQKLERHRPETLGHAARISGVTPAALSLLLVHLKRGPRPQKKRA